MIVNIQGGDPVATVIEGISEFVELTKGTCSRSTASKGKRRTSCKWGFIIMQSLDNYTRMTAESYLSWHCLSYWKTEKIGFMSNNKGISQ